MMLDPKIIQKSMKIEEAQQITQRNVFLHSFAASKCKKGSNASLIGDELSKLMRKTKTRLMS